jgi:hypothetical protein
MNEHVQKGDEALAREDLKTAKAEFKLAMSDPSIVTRRNAEDRLNKIKERKLSEWDKPESGWLRYLGYGAGKKGKPKKERRDILKKAFYQTISIRETRFTEEQVKWWGQAGSEERFKKLCIRLSAFISSSSLTASKEEAVINWREDLEWLESEFIKEVSPENSPE